MRRRTFCVAVLLLVAASQAFGQNYRYGIHTYYLSPYLAAKTRELGTGYVRIEIDWDALQPDGPNQWNDEQLVSWLTEARANKLKLYATLMNTPGWAGPCQHCMPDRGADWQTFVHRVMSEIHDRFKDVDVVYGIWNEPNLTGPQGFFMGSDADYATLFSLADVARRLANPTARLAGPELSAGGIDPRGYLDSVVTRMQPSLRFSDVLTIHWYPGQGTLTDWISALAAKSRGQEVWLTETGANTCDDSEQRSWIDYVLNTFDHGSPTVRWTRTFIYYLWDAETDCAANIVRMDGTNRPAFSDYRNRTTKQFSPVRPIGVKTLNGSNLAGISVFDLVDINGGELKDGDPIALMTPTGLYLQAENGGGGRLLQSGFAPAAWETFTVIDLDRPGEPVRPGDAIALKSSGGFYVSAEGGGSGTTTVNRQSVGGWETFKLVN